MKINQHQNNEVICKVEERSLLKVIARRQENEIGNILRGRSVLKDEIERRYEGNRPRERKRNFV